MLLEHTYKEYNNSYGFCMKECSLQELFEIFDDLEEIEKSKTTKKDKILAINEFLNSYGWSDEEIINGILKRKKGKFIVTFIDDSNLGYFRVFEVKKNEYKRDR